MKMKAQYETEVYLAASDYLVIKQTDALGEEALICLSHEQVKILSAELRKYAKDGNWWAGVVRETNDAP